MLKRYAWLDTFLRAHSGVTYDWKEEWQWHRYLLDGKLFQQILFHNGEVPPLTARNFALFLIVTSL